MANLIFDLNGPKLWIELNDETFKCLTSSLSKKEVTSHFIDLSRITLQWANTKKWGRGLGGQFHTNHCILSTWASSWCPCLQECGKGLLVCSWHEGEVWPVKSEKIGVTGLAKKKKQFSWCKKSIFIFSLMLVTSMLYDMNASPCVSKN